VFLDSDFMFRTSRSGPRPLEEAARRQTGVTVSRELAGGACEWRAAHQALARVSVDTTVQPKAIGFPTDAKLLHAAIKGLTGLARKHGVRLRRAYLRL
jgi:hypothetical protein